MHRLLIFISTIITKNIYYIQHNDGVVSFILYFSRKSKKDFQKIGIICISSFHKHPSIFYHFHIHISSLEHTNHYWLLVCRYRCMYQLRRVFSFSLRPATLASKTRLSLKSSSASSSSEQASNKFLVMFRRELKFISNRSMVRLCSLISALYTRH